MSVSEIITTYQQLGIGGVLILVVVIVGRHLLKQNKDCYVSYQEHVTQHKNEIKGLNKDMLEVLKENTKANTILAKAIDHLDISIKEYRAKRAGEP